MFRQIASLILASALAAQPLLAQPQEAAAAGAHGNAVLWIDPGDIRTKNLYWGPGGKQRKPPGPMRFVEEDTKGTSPKFDVRDREGKKWRAKLGVEAQPETAATRLLWAVGYVANETYFFPQLEIEDMPRLKRGRNLASDGDVRNVRLQRRPHGDKKADTWDWRHNPFYGTREFNGLRVMMALMSNWDLKRENNAVTNDVDSGRELYEVSDVGASFGRMGQSYSEARSKGNLKAYVRSKFIAKVTPEYVDFNFPTHLPLIYIFNFPLFFGQLHTRWVGRRVPRQDVKWISSLLTQLSPEQLRDVFRAAGYSPQAVESYAAAVQARIAQLSKL